MSTPIPNKDNHISCRRVGGRLISLAEEKTNMTFLELKNKLNELNDDQLDMDMEVILSPTETVIVELAIGTNTDALFFVPEFDWVKE